MEQRVSETVTWSINITLSLLTGVNEGLLRQLQSVQNAASRLVTGMRRCEHITPALRQLHWLPVRQRIQYKLSSLAFRALSDLVPDYLAGDWQLFAFSGRRPLRSAKLRVCHVPRQNSTFGDHSFAAAGPRTWHELPFSLRGSGLSLTTFNEHFENIPVLRRVLRPRRICGIYDSFAPCINLLTYSLTYMNKTNRRSNFSEVLV